MKPYKVEFDEVISDKDIKDGNVIMLTGRPGTGKTLTCCRLIKKYEGKYKSLYFNLSGDGLSYWFKNKIPDNILNRYHTSVEIIKKVEDVLSTENLKFVFIDYWQLINDQEEWFIRKLIEFSYNNKIVFIITTQLPRKIVKGKYQMTIKKKLAKMNNLSIWARKHIVICRKYVYESSGVEDDLEYFVYRHGFE